MSFEDRLEKRIEYSMEEIEIRIESLKTELDDLFLKMTDELMLTENHLLSLNK